MSHRKVVEKTGKKGILILLATLAFYTLGFAPGIAITVTGSWSLSIGQANLQGAAGSDLSTYYESATTQLTMAISGSNGHTWRVDVKRVNVTWHSDFRLYIKRTNGGTSGSGSLYAGGTEYVLITQNNQTFWTGIGDRAGIYLQYQLTGVSCAIPAASYSNTIYFTIVQTN